MSNHPAITGPRTSPPAAPEGANDGQIAGGSQPQAGESRLQRFVCQTAVYLSVYIFSLGPMYWRWLDGKYMHGSKVVAVLYEPLFLLSGWFPPLGWFLNLYLRVWILDLRLWTL